MNGDRTAVLIISEDAFLTEGLNRALAEAGYAVATATNTASAITTATETEPKVAFVDLALRTSGPSGFRDLIGQLKEAGGRFVLGIVSPRHLGDIDPFLGLDDFFLATASADEVVARLRLRLGPRIGAYGDSAIRRGDLTIDTESYQVYVSGRPAALTFKEYELLRFLATNPERVFGRESLLNRVWGYDYFGGERTVDVHIRRLRSKIEDADRTFIETVRNVGYRFHVGP